jgi:DNA-directed RNA polymerase subunit RPC12/RpoP
MSYFVRFFGSGWKSKKPDPREKVFAEYHCSLCGEDMEIDVTGIINQFDINRERRCKHCRQLNANDKEMNLKAQLDKLTSDKSRIQIEIDQIERELNELKSVKEK